ncbi:(Fe-S)-binding protein [Natronoflexus pectinivorans]|uniref:L-lactate dehydrogenase complex protein LldE n=1 Tax=Natronoflexus pectinivorans TaxID=682526 RepID=A0A4V6NMQ8_9BACT|nr:(Fe-S)-binding protein [Natronoflexus pectinivorans]TCO08718.1 L-lactate dehydrogenase complex protein LldE [Natronoflexus pectinivorans]
MKVELYIPCFINEMFPRIGFDMIKTLEKAGVEVNYNPEQTCCGQPFYNSGYWKHSEKMAEKFLTDFSGDVPIIVPSASCAGFIKNHYSKIFENQPDVLQRLNNVVINVFEYTDFLVNHLKVTSFDADFSYKVTYHDGCSALRDYGLKNEPRVLLSNVSNLELIEMAETGTCCGFGGTFMVKFPSVSVAMAEQKLEHALNTGAEYIISSEASCFINLNSIIEKRKLPIKTAHIARVLASF